MKRGFKTSAENLAIELRKAIAHDDRVRLDLKALCSHLEIHVMELGTVEDEDEHVEHLHTGDPYAFSAAVMIGPAGRLMLINSMHPEGRLANSMAHEISHVVLEHPPRPAFDALGNREWPANEEAEANWLAGCLLAPRSGLITVLTSLGEDLMRGAEHYGISVDLMRQRWHQTGCAKQLENGRRRRL